MNFKKINFRDVRAELDLGVPVKFNSSFHTQAQAPDLSIPTNLPYDFQRWLPLILRTRGIPSDDLQTARLTPSMARLLANVSAASINTRTINRAYAEDLEDEIGPALASLQYPPEGLFMRFGACSAKDGVWSSRGTVAVHSYEDIILQLTTSTRAWITVTNYLNKNPQSPLPLFFLPFDSRIKTEMEYRVFCAPESLRVCAVSQYEWHKPWRFSTRSETEMQTAASTILQGINQIRALIVAELKAPGTDEADDLLRRQGMTFDVWYDNEAGKVTLVELNTYGVRSACGSCLFHWVNDRETMYDASEVEFRVVVDQDQSLVQSQTTE